MKRREPPDLQIVRVEEGEEGKDENLTEERAERIAAWIATPSHLRRDEDPGTLTRLARDLGCTSGSMSRWKDSRAVRDRILDNLEGAALSALPDILYGQIVAATAEFQEQPDGTVLFKPGDLRSAGFVAAFAKAIQPGGKGGVAVNVTQTNQNMNAGELHVDQMSDAELKAALKETADRMK